MNAVTKHIFFMILCRSDNKHFIWQYIWSHRSEKVWYSWFNRPSIKTCRYHL